MEPDALVINMLICPLNLTLSMELPHIYMLVGFTLERLFHLKISGKFSYTFLPMYARGEDAFKKERNLHATLEKIR